MKEIKFRVWDKKNNCMIYVTLDELEEGYCEQCASEYGFGDLDEDEKRVKRFCEIKSPRQQFTGRKDKNKKEIYKGDIVLAKWMEDDNARGTIVYDSDNGQYLIVFDIYGASRIFSSDVKIIGNIYENPEIIQTIGIDKSNGTDKTAIVKTHKNKDGTIVVDDIELKGSEEKAIKEPANPEPAKYPASYEREMKIKKALEGHNLPTNFTARRCFDAGMTYKKEDEPANPESVKSMQDTVNERILKGMLNPAEIKGIVFSADRDLLFEALLSKFNYMFLRVPGSKTIITDIIGEDMKYKIINEFAKTFNLNFTTDWEDTSKPKSPQEELEELVKTPILSKTDLKKYVEKLVVIGDEIIKKPPAPDNQIEIIDEFADVKGEDIKKMKQILPEIENLVISKGGRFIPRTPAPCKCPEQFKEMDMLIYGNHFCDGKGNRIEPEKGIRLFGKHAPLANLKLKLGSKPMKHDWTKTYPCSKECFDYCTKVLDSRDKFICICGGKPDAWKGAEEAIEESERWIVDGVGSPPWHPYSEKDWKKGERK